MPTRSNCTALARPSLHLRSKDRAIPCRPGLVRVIECPPCRFCRHQFFSLCQRLLGIGKRGNPYLSGLFVQGARAVMQMRSKLSPGLSCWLEGLSGWKHTYVAAIALANKLARKTWAVLAKGEPYRPRVLANISAAWRNLSANAVSRHKTPSRQRSSA